MFWSLVQATKRNHYVMLIALESRWVLFMKREKVKKRTKKDFWQNTTNEKNVKKLKIELEPFSENLNQYKYIRLCQNYPEKI